jgi:hypothetical protein
MLGAAKCVLVPVLAMHADGVDKSLKPFPTLKHGEVYNAIGKHNPVTDASVHSFCLDLNRFADFTNEEYQVTYLIDNHKP